VGAGDHAGRLTATNEGCETLVLAELLKHASWAEQSVRLFHYDDTLLVEITGPGGKTLDTIQVPAAQLALRKP
jgi:hypothetical protein